MVGKFEFLEIFAICFIAVKICSLLRGVLVHLISLSQDEINHFGLLDHPNIVNLIGYCLEEDHRMLVCEFMSGGNLGKHLFRSKFWS